MERCSRRDSAPSESASTDEDTLRDAGSDLLHHYQMQWADLHRATKEAAEAAESVDHLCFLTGQSICKRQALVRDFECLVKCLPEVENSIEGIADDLSKTIACLEELEQAIQSKEELIFESETRKRFDAQYVLKIHEEKLHREFEKIAISLESDHMKRVRELKRSEENAIRAKQESFRRAFEQELIAYKMDGRIKRPENAQAASVSSVSLDEILVEPDEDDRVCLEQFLQEDD